MNNNNRTNHRPKSYIVLAVLLVFELVCIGVDAILYHFGIGKKYISVLSTIILLVCVACIFSFIFIVVSFVRRFFVWEKETFTYEDDKRLKLIDQKIQSLNNNELSTEAVYSYINNVYGKDDISMDNLLSRRHFIENKEVVVSNFKELMVTIIIALIFPFCGQSLKEYGIDSGYVSFMICLIVALFIAMSILMNHIKPKYSAATAIYRYEHMVIEEHLIKIQKSLVKEDNDDKCGTDNGGNVMKKETPNLNIGTTESKAHTTEPHPTPEDSTVLNDMNADWVKKHIEKFGVEPNLFDGV